MATAEAGAGGPRAAPGRPSFGRRRLWFWARLLVAMVLVAVILRAIDFHEALAMLGRTDLRLVGLTVLLALADRFVMAFKWNLLLGARGLRFPAVEAFRIYLASGFVGATLPTGVGGDMFRAVRSSMSGRGMSSVSATILVERALGLLAVAVLSTGALAVLVATGARGMTNLLMVSALMVVTVSLALVFSVHPRVFEMVRRLTAPHAQRRPVRIFLSLHDGCLELSRSRGLMLRFTALSILEQFVQVGMNCLAARAIGLPVTLLQLTGLVPISNVLVMLPISIASIGVLEGTYVFVLGLVGVTPAGALSLTLLMRAIGWVMLIPNGAAFLWDSATLRARSGSDAS